MLQGLLAKQQLLTVSLTAARAFLTFFVHSFFYIFMILSFILGCSQGFLLVEKPGPDHYCGCRPIMLNMPRNTGLAACKAKAEEIGAGCFNYRWIVGSCTLRMCNSLELKWANQTGNVNFTQQSWQYQIYSGLSSCSFELP